MKSADFLSFYEKNKLKIRNLYLKNSTIEKEKQFFLFFKKSTLVIT
jgi:hypothetical protein